MRINKRVNRKDVVDFYIMNKERFTQKDVAGFYKVSLRSFTRWYANYHLLNYNYRQKRMSKIKINIKKTIESIITSNPFTRLIDIKYDIKKIHNLDVSLSSISYILRELKYTYKRARIRVRDYNKLTKDYKTFKDTMGTIPIGKIISIDESGFNRQMYPIYGRCKSGKKLEHYISKKTSSENYSLLMAISSQNILKSDIIKGSINAILFNNFICELNKSYQNCYFLMDNARIHHNKELMKIMKNSTNKIIYNIPYSPEFNPIEHCFSEIKQTFRRINNGKDTNIIQIIIQSINMLHRPNLLKYYIKSLVTDLQNY